MYSVILVDYNGMEKTAEYIDRCITGLCSDKRISFIIVENGSQAGHTVLGNRYGACREKYCAAVKENVKVYNYENHIVVYYKAEGNLGYARGNNRGIRISEELFTDTYYIISNNDIRFPKPLELDRIEKRFNNEKTGVVGPRVVGADGKEQSPRKKMSAFSLLFLSYWYAAVYGVLKKQVSDVDYDNRSKGCYWVSGCFMIVRAEAIKSCRYFDEGTFLFAEEMILAERLRKKGYGMFFDNGIEIYHEESTTVKKSNSLLERIEMSFRSQLYYFVRYRGLRRPIKRLAVVNFSVWKYLYLLNEKLRRRPAERRE